MAYLPSDTFIGRAIEKYGEYAQAEVEFLCSVVRQGDVVVDAGANIGAIAVPLAQAVGPRGKVLAFEPQRLVFQMLCANAVLNGLTNVHAVSSALGAQLGKLYLTTPNYEREGNFGAVSLGRDGLSGAEVHTVDLVDLDRLDLMKVDVEGMEADVLRGAEKTIARCRPLLYVENDRPQKSEELVELLRSMNYDLWWHVTPLYNPENYKEDLENLWPGVGSVDMLCAPRERHLDLNLEPVTDPVWAGLRNAA